jgi:hypothetical protein
MCNRVENNKYNLACTVPQNITKTIAETEAKTIRYINKK